MSSAQGRVRSTPSVGLGSLAVLALVGCAPATAGNAGDGAYASRSTADAPPSIVDASLVFDGVTVVDVERGKLIPAQRVVIAGSRVQTVGGVNAVTMPKDAQVVDARGKYLIPGLWDLHMHTSQEQQRRRYALDFFYPLLLTNGVTGIRDPSSDLPLDTLLQRRQEILAGMQVGPPRQLFSGPSISEEGRNSAPKPCRRRTDWQICVAATPADARHVVDSLKAAGADMIKTYVLSPRMYFAIAAAARRAGIPFGGHIPHPEGLPVADASDSGASIIDHVRQGAFYSQELDSLCLGQTATVASCRPVAERLRRNGTWLVPTRMVHAVDFGAPPRFKATLARFKERTRAFWDGTLLHGNWLRDSALSEPFHVAELDSVAASRNQLRLAQQVGLPLLAGTDAATDWMRQITPGFSLHAELASYVADGMTPLYALQTATLNPAKMLHATDSLGTVAPGKLADLVLLDADPLADITNTTTIRAVVANGRYFDRAALDSLLVEVQAKGKKKP